MVRPVDRVQRPAPSTRTIFMTHPTIAAHNRVYPNWLPAASVATRSPAPTPVAATTRPGPTNFHRGVRSASCVTWITESGRHQRDQTIGTTMVAHTTSGAITTIDMPPLHQTTEDSVTNLRNRNPGLR